MGSVCYVAPHMASPSPLEAVLTRLDPIRLAELLRNGEASYEHERSLCVLFQTRRLLRSSRHLLTISRAALERSHARLARANEANKRRRIFSALASGATSDSKK
jgi:hypothetical protein